MDNWASFHCKSRENGNFFQIKAIYRLNFSFQSPHFFHNFTDEKYIIDNQFRVKTLILNHSLIQFYHLVSPKIELPMTF